MTVRWIILVCIFSSFVFPPGSAVGSTLEKRANVTVDIPPATLAALVDFASTHYNVNILYSGQRLHRYSTPEIQGQLSFDDFMQRALAGSDIVLEKVDNNTFVLRETQSPEPAGNNAFDKRHHLPAMDEIIVTGTRLENRTVFNSLSAVDVVAQPAQVSSSEIIDSLALQLPAFTAYRLPLSDGRIFNRSSGLRGLNSDHTLILVNGKRRHRSAFLETQDGHPIDMSHIPLHAIKRIEVLRDGATALYGSDAIAGVINLILDDSPTPELFLQTSRYYEGDGTTYRASVKTGWRQTESDFGVVTFSAVKEDATSRATQPADAIAFQQRHPDIIVPNPVQRWGQPERHSVKASMNAEHSFDHNAIGYLFSTLSFTHGVSDFNWRNPDTNLVFKQSNHFANFALNTTYPAGFTPHFGQDEKDIALTTGVIATLNALTQIDISASAGQNTIDYFIDNTINASLGPLSSKSFRPGKLRQQEVALDADLTLTFASPWLSSSASIAAGVSLREERYQVNAGNFASWAVGPAAIEGLPAGSNGFPGYSPEQAGEYSQQSGAIYGEIGLPVSPDWQIDMAVRYENYALFSDIVRGKLSSRFEISPALMVRATLSNGFRAPTAGQFFTERTSQSLNQDYNSVTTSGRLSPLSPVADLLSRRDNVNITDLKPERSENISMGIGFKPSAEFSLTLDFYRIFLRDRFGISQTYELTPAEREIMQSSADYQRYPIDTVNFFHNTFDTRTTGFDVVFTTNTDFLAGKLTVIGAYNYNRSKITGGAAKSDIIQRTQLEEGLPQHRSTLSATYETGDWDFQLVWRYVSSWEDQAQTGSEEFQTFSSIHFFDAAATYYASSNLTFKLGLENLFNNYPDRATLQANRGLLYSRNAPYDTDGGLVYLRTEFRF